LLSNKIAEANKNVILVALAKFDIPFDLNDLYFVLLIYRGTGGKVTGMEKNHHRLDKCDGK
jgi:hypothetical protein